jgi:hypothetical protein
VAGCGTHSDTDRDGVLDICEDCDDNGIPDPCDLSCASAGCNVPGCGTGTDCDGDTVLDSCQSADDCNENSVNDICDLESGTSLDCNSNSVPDECDVASATSLDCNSNGVPDECDPDCNENTIPDDCDITGSTSLDCNDNSIPDECDIVQFDCNDNGIPDDCDIANATSTDSDENGIPDECCPPPCEPEPLLANTFGTCTTGNANCVVGGPACASGTCDTCGQVRSMSFVIPATSAGTDTAVRVKLTSLYDVVPPLPTSGVNPGPALAPFEGQYRYLNLIPGTLSRCCNPASNPTACNTSVTCTSDANCVGLGLNTKCMKNLCPDSPAFATFFRCARLGCTPEYRDWGSDFSGLVTYASGDSVVSDSTYHVANLADSCAGNEAACAAASAELMVKTERWGNVDCTTAVVPNATDIGFVVSKVKDAVGAFIKPRTQLREAIPNPLALVGAQDIARIVDAVKGRHYPDAFTIGACP